MRGILIGLLAGWFISSGVATVAAPEQNRPGEPTKGEVWIQNRGDAGQDSWDVAGVFPVPGGAAVLLKRPR